MANAWVLSPSSSSLDAPPSQSSSPAIVVGVQILFALPRRLWDAYVAYLWYYQPNSWVGRVASTFRVLAVALILPVVLLTLLDVTAYVIARTLGVDDEAKASASDSDIAAADDQGRVPTDFMSEGPARGSEGLVPGDSVEGPSSGDVPGDGGGRAEDGRGSGSERVVRAASATARVGPQAGTWGGEQMQTGTRALTGTVTVKGTSASEASPRAYYFTGDEGLRLAGEGVFSPAVSVPPSPFMPDMPLPAFIENDDGGAGLASEEGTVLRRRVQNAREDEQVYST